MILINLLPHRELARKRRKDLFNAGLGLSALAGVLVAGLIFVWFQSHISGQQDKNQILNREIAELDRQIKDIAGMESEIASLRARQQAVENLQADRNIPVHLLTEVVKQLPEGVYISGMRQDGQNVALEGVAQSNERVSELLRNLSTKSIWLTRPELIEIVAGSVNLSPRDQRRVANFKISVELIRADEAGNKGPVAAPAGMSVDPLLTASSSVAR